MARRGFIKAYGDIVGGVGNDVSISIGPDVSRKPSTLKLTSRDVSHGKRQAVEFKPVEGKQIPKCPLQAAHLQRRNEPIQAESGKNHFVNIDGDGTAAMEDVQSKQQSKALPQTAYETRSFMSSLDLCPSRKPQQPNAVNQRNLNAPPPSWNPEKPKMPEDVKMFLPKGIDHKDKPYVVPKFMPSYRDMMAPRTKPDPLVSIVEPTPPSMQKWAIEWNAEPKSISIAELEEDIIRETAEKSPAPPRNIPSGPSTNGISRSFLTNEAKQNRPSCTPEPRKVSCHAISETVGNNQGSSPNSVPWKNLQIPVDYDHMGPKEPIKGKRNLGKPLIDWVPSRFSNVNHLQNSEYSFKEAIAQGVTVKANTSNSNADTSKLPLPKSTVNSVYFDTEEQKFHEWFKERMSAAVQSVVHDQPKKHYNNQGAGQGNQPAVKGISKPEYSVHVNNPNGHGVAQAEEGTRKNGMNDCFAKSDGMIPPVMRDPPKVTNKVSHVPHEPESSSSFCHWLKLRGHPIVKKELPAPERKSKGSTEKIVNQNTSKFPWSVSYTLRKNKSTRAIHKRLPTHKKISQSHRSISQNEIGQLNKPHVIDSVKSGTMKFPGTAGKTFLKTTSKRSIKGAAKKKSVGSESKASVGRSMSKTPNADLPRQAASIENAYPGLFGDKWNIDSEVDHVNNVRRTEMVTSNSKVTNSKKPFPSLTGPQMKYWETKYCTPPKSDQSSNLSSPQTPGSRTKTAHKWYRSKKSTEGIKRAFNDSSNAIQIENGRSEFSSIDEVAIPFRLDGNQLKDQIMDFSYDFDVDGFLRTEESVEKELLNMTHRTPDVQPQGTKGNEEVSRKVPVKELIKFTRSAQVRPEGASNADKTPMEKVRQKLDEDDLVMALGEDPVAEDLEWSEFIGPRNGLDSDADLTRMLASQARQISFEQNSCL